MLDSFCLIKLIIGLSPYGQQRFWAASSVKLMRAKQRLTQQTIICGFLLDERKALESFSEFMEVPVTERETQICVTLFGIFGFVFVEFSSVAGVRRFLLIRTPYVV